MAVPDTRDTRDTRERIHQPEKLADHLADGLTSFAGSWWFLGLHTLWFTLWIALRVEPFPYGLLTMAVSLEAIGLSTLVMLSQNRASARDHVRDDLEAREVAELFEMNKNQLEILHLLKDANANAKENTHE